MCNLCFLRNTLNKIPETAIASNLCFFVIHGPRVVMLWMHKNAQFCAITRHVETHFHYSQLIIWQVLTQNYIFLCVHRIIGAIPNFSNIYIYIYINIIGMNWGPYTYCVKGIYPHPFKQLIQILLQEFRIEYYVVDNVVKT